MMMANPPTANHEDFSPCQPRESRRCKNAEYKNHVTSAQTSLASQPQKRSQAICAQMEAKIKAPSVKSGNPMATARYVTSSTRSALIFLSKGCIAAPILFLNNKRRNPYRISPTINDQRSVLNFLAALLPCNQPGASNKASCTPSVINTLSLGAAMAGKLYSAVRILSPDEYSNSA